jgi:hypothetical protein
MNPIDLNVNCSSAVHVATSNVARFGDFPVVVGLCGSAGAGKSTCALWLEEHGYLRIRFAGPLKQMLLGLGLDQRHTDGDQKEVPNRLLNGRTPRQAMQWLGTEWGRNLFGDDFWVNIWREQATNALKSGRPVVVDDLRFANEAAAVRALNGKIVKIACPWAGSASGAGHASESGDFHHDIVVANDLRGHPERMLVRLAEALGIRDDAVTAA